MEKLQAVVQKVTKEAPNINRIYFLLSGNWKLEYIAGQYITVYISDSGTPQGKAYSLSSAPHEKQMSITVKNVGGEYSSYLCSLKKGDKFMISRAYGFFNPKTSRPIVALAAGVGVSPIISVIKDEAHKNNHATRLHLSNKSHQYIAHSSDLVSLDTTVRHYITAELTVPNHMSKGRIALDSCVNTAEDAFYMICGSLQFVRDMWQGLVERGIAPESITTETFFES